VTESRSLKDKRHVLSSLSERLKRSFNVAVCEVEYQDQWQRTQIAVVGVNTNWRMLQSTLSRVSEFVDRDRRLQVIDVQTRQLC
jgi:uncharacterized protein YlxP (DUF503 family)